MSLKKADLTNAISNRLDVSRSKANDLVGSVLEIIKTSLANGEGALVSGFGKSSVKEKKEWLGRNQQTEENLMMDARRVVSFKCSPKLRHTIQRQ